MKLAVEFDLEVDGRWIAEVRSVPGALAYGRTRARAKASALGIARRVLAESPDRRSSRHRR